jgi:hypothetical protein
MPAPTAAAVAAAPGAPSADEPKLVRRSRVLYDTDDDE